MQRTPEELRKEAADIRFRAKHAERLRDARRELEMAAQLEAEADRIDGVTPAPAPLLSPQQMAERTEQARRKRVAAAILQIKERFGPKK